MEILAAVGENLEGVLRWQRMGAGGEPELQRASVDATVLATLKLLQRVTLNYDVAKQVGGGRSSLR